jgi:hypothetical protein
MQEMTILALLGIYSEVTKKSMLSPHRSQNSTTLLAGNHKPLCTEAILWDPNFGEYHLLFKDELLDEAKWLQQQIVNLQNKQAELNKNLQSIQHQCEGKGKILEDDLPQQR